MSAHELAFVGLAGSSLGTAIGLPMAWPRRGSERQVQIFGLALVLLSIIGALISARLAGLTPSSDAVGHAINLIGLLAMPLQVIYARHSVGLPLTPAQAGWWLPAAAYTAWVAACVMTGADTSVPFAWIAPFACGSTMAAGVTLWRHRRTPRQAVLVPPDAVVAFMALVNVAQLIRMEFAEVAPVRAIVPLAMSAGFAALAAFAAWRATTTASRPVSPARYERSGLEESAARHLLARVERALQHDRLHTRVDLTLAQLAAAVGATPHQLSEAINRYAGTSFTELITRRRVDDVKAQLRDPANDRFTIEGIGISAGFGSRSALYTAFKRCEGVTPTEFRRVARSK